MRKIILFLVVVFAATNSYSQCACCASAGVSASNGNYSNGTLTLPKKQIVVEGYSDYQTIKQGNTPEGEEKLLKNMFVSSLGARYGITNKLTVSVLLPYVFLHTNSGNDKGLGDLTLMGTYNIYSKNNFNFAVQAGVELPTGIQKNSNFDNTTVIVGSGSYDPMAGIVFSKKWGELTLQGSGLFKRTTNGFHGNYYGNLSVQNISLSYRIMGENDFCSLDTSTKMKS